MKSTAVAMAALRWWKLKAPPHWTTEQHLDQPCVNLRGKEEFELGLAIAEMLKERKKS